MSRLTLLELLETAVIVDAAGNMAAAGAHLYLTPAAVWQRMLRLEQRLGTAVFERRPGGAGRTMVAVVDVRLLWRVCRECCEENEEEGVRPIED